MGIILAGFSYVLLCSIAYLPGFASTGSLVVKPNIKLRERKVMIGLICGRTAFNRVACCRLDQDIRGKET